LRQAESEPHRRKSALARHAKKRRGALCARTTETRAPLPSGCSVAVLRCLPGWGLASGKHRRVRLAGGAPPPAVCCFEVEARTILIATAWGLLWGSWLVWRTSAVSGNSRTPCLGVAVGAHHVSHHQPSQPHQPADFFLTGSATDSVPCWVSGDAATTVAGTDTGTAGAGEEAAATSAGATACCDSATRRWGVGAGVDAVEEGCAAACALSLPTVTAAGVEGGVAPIKNDEILVR